MKVLLALLLGIWLHGVASSEVREFENPDQQQRYETLVKDLRCLVCQNQSLADSDADLAKDLREEVYDIIRSGKSDQEAVKFLVDRYGDFVLYRPPFSTMTLMLWLGPAVLLLVGLVFIWRRSRHQREAAATGLTPAERARLDELRKDSHG